MDQEEISQRDEQAKKAGLMIGIPGEVYFTSISKKSDVYVEHINGKWEAWRERNSSPKNDCKTIIRDYKFETVMKRVKSYLKFVLK